MTQHPPWHHHLPPPPSSATSACQHVAPQTSPNDASTHCLGQVIFLKHILCSVLPLLTLPPLTFCRGGVLFYINLCTQNGPKWCVDGEAQPLYPQNQFYFISNGWNALWDEYQRHQDTTAWVQHTAAQYSTLLSSTTIRPSFVIVLKIPINKCQNHSIPAVQCMEITSHPISTCDRHFCLLSSLPSITRSNPWGCTLLSATVIQYKGLQSLAIGHPASLVISRLALYVLLSILHYYFLSKACF